MWGIWDIGIHWNSLDTFGSHHWLCQVGSEAPGVLATPKARFTLNIRCILRPEMKCVCFSLFVCFFNQFFKRLTVDGTELERFVAWPNRWALISTPWKEQVGAGWAAESCRSVNCCSAFVLSSCYILLYPVVQKACWTFELSKPQVVDSGSHRCYRYRFFVSKLTFRVV